MAICRQCSAVFTPARASKGIYCSNQHQKDYEFDQKYIKFLAGDSSDLVGVRSLKRAVIRRDGYKCSCCGIADWNGKELVLEIEHKDGDSTNNSPDNICLLCPNYHSQTPTYKAKNKGNGRHSRRQRYEDGKSY